MSKDATWSTSGLRWRIARMRRTLCGWCSGASGIRASIAARGLVRDEGRSRKGVAAVHDPMSDADEGIGREMGRDPAEAFRDDIVQIVRNSRLERAVRGFFILRQVQRERRVTKVDRTGADAAQRIPFAGEQAELDGRRPPD